MSTTTHSLYRRAAEADEAFHAELVRQFGEDDAAVMRYRPEAYDEATAYAAAAARKWSRAYLMECEASRSRIDR